MPPLPERLARSRATTGSPLCGGNGMGFLNPDTGLRATGFATPDDLPAGPVTFISHSGLGVRRGVPFNDRGIGFNLLVSSGQEFVSTMADYLAYALDLRVARRSWRCCSRPSAIPRGSCAALAKPPSATSRWSR